MKLVRWQILGAAAIILVSMGCSQGGPASPQAASTPPPPQPTPEPSDAEAAPPPSRLPVAILPDGFEITLELAVTEEEAIQGLRFRPSMADEDGMLFLFSAPGRHSIWMKDTWIPLDIVFLDGDGTVTQLVADAQPCKVDPCPTYTPERPIAAMLELVAGSAARHGIKAGERLRFEHVPGYPTGRGTDSGPSLPANS